MEMRRVMGRWASMFSSQPPQEAMVARQRLPSSFRCQVGEPMSTKSPPRVQSKTVAEAELSAFSHQSAGVSTVQRVPGPSKK